MSGRKTLTQLDDKKQWSALSFPAFFRFLICILFFFHSPLFFCLKFQLSVSYRSTHYSLAGKSEVKEVTQFGNIYRMHDILLYVRLSDYRHNHRREHTHTQIYINRYGVKQ